ncbi:hypothetical protein C8F01DRAFT_1179552 [Mycena amicta]|nr:hypothetical protein C8F01DRAFT_1179552 [Mycena amicta]
MFTFYCSAQCQKMDWKGSHRDRCSEVRDARRGESGSNHVGNQRTAITAHRERGDLRCTKLFLLQNTPGFHIRSRQAGHSSEAPQLSLQLSRSRHTSCAFRFRLGRMRHSGWHLRASERSLRYTQRYASARSSQCWENADSHPSAQKRRLAAIFS